MMGGPKHFCSIGFGFKIWTSVNFDPSAPVPPLDPGVGAHGDRLRRLIHYRFSDAECRWLGAALDGGASSPWLVRDNDIELVVRLGHQQRPLRHVTRQPAHALCLRSYLLSLLLLLLMMMMMWWWCDVLGIKVLVLRKWVKSLESAISHIYWIGGAGLCR